MIFFVKFICGFIVGWVLWGHPNKWASVAGTMAYWLAVIMFNHRI